jgi:glucose-6-phosphate isomerase
MQDQIRRNGSGPASHRESGHCEAAPVHIALSCYNKMVVVSLFNDSPPSQPQLDRFEANNTLARLRTLDSMARRKGLEALDPGKSPLVEIGCEIAPDGKVTKNSYGVLNLAWRAASAGDWPERVAKELKQIRARLTKEHGSRLRFVIWAGMGGSAEDKTAYNLTRLLAKGPRLYVLDSTDPAKLKAILADAERRSKLSLKEVLESTLVVGMAMGMTSYEPVVNLEKLSELYDKHKIDSRPNFIYMTLPGSLLDKFAGPRGYRRVDLQLDGENSTAGRHSAPLTRGSLYPLSLAGQNLRTWIDGANLTEDTIHEAWTLAAFLQTQAQAGRDKVSWLLPRSWLGAGLWTKQDFEESLGKSEAIGIKIVIGEAPRAANYKRPKDPRQNRVFVAIQRKGEVHPHTERLSMIRRQGYPVAFLTIPARSPLSAYMQFVHYTVFGLSFLRQMNFVTQPSVELYKAITAKLHEEAKAKGGIQATEAWAKFNDPAMRVAWRGRVFLHTAFYKGSAPTDANPAAAYACILKASVASGEVDSAELTFFGDTRYSDSGRAMRRSLDRAAEGVFRTRLHLPVDVYEGPAMNHSYHEMIIGHGKCISTILFSAKGDSLPEADYTSGYHTAQFLATQMALAERGRRVVALVVRDLEPPSLRALDEFFGQVALHLKS